MQTTMCLTELDLHLSYVFIWNSLFRFRIHCNKNKKKQQNSKVVQNFDYLLMDHNEQKYVTKVLYVTIS